MPLSPGRRLGPYEIVAPLGKGGMGEVCQAGPIPLDEALPIARQFAEGLGAAHERGSAEDPEVVGVSGTSSASGTTMRGGDLDARRHGLRAGRSGST